ncbi:hypothetical protein HDV01_007149 [Terramyces sp. JEL0728]|nr:hypothetical protein HDV01_007149 [Terramyces sp. JEL0728]
MLPIIFATFTLGATINFNADYTVQVQGDLVSGTNATVNYDMSRAQCHHAYYNGFDTYGVYLNYVFNDDFVNTVTTAIARGTPTTHYTPIIPLQKGKLAMWVFCSSEQDTTYDSNYGTNWILAVN